VYSPDLNMLRFSPTTVHWPPLKIAADYGLKDAV